MKRILYIILLCFLLLSPIAHVGISAGLMVVDIVINGGSYAQVMCELGQWGNNLYWITNLEFNSQAYYEHYQCKGNNLFY